MIVDEIEEKNQLKKNKQIKKMSTKLDMKYKW